MLEKILRKTWLLRPLTLYPHQRDAVVSDLFVWRNSAEWKTIFELIDIAFLFNPADRQLEGNQSKLANFLFFNQIGDLVSRTSVKLYPNQRCSLSLSSLLENCSDEYGTFACFQGRTPEIISAKGSFLAERGYVGYRFNQSPLCSYVHGNLDAIALSPGHSPELLGQSGLRSREYRLQYLFTGPATYELMLVNPTNRKQKVHLTVLQKGSSISESTQSCVLLPKGVHKFDVTVAAGQTAQGVIFSQLLLARPLVFRIVENSIDVFHG